MSGFFFCIWHKDNIFLWSIVDCGIWGMTAYPLHLGLNWSGKVVCIYNFCFIVCFIYTVYAFPLQLFIWYLWRRDLRHVVTYHINFEYWFNEDFINHKIASLRYVNSVSVATVLGTGIPECLMMLVRQLTCTFIRCGLCSHLEPLTFYFEH